MSNEEKTTREQPEHVEERLKEFDEAGGAAEVLKSKRRKKLRPKIETDKMLFLEGNEVIYTLLDQGRTTPESKGEIAAEFLLIGEVMAADVENATGGWAWSICTKLAQRQHELLLALMRLCIREIGNGWPIGKGFRIDESAGDIT